MLVQRVDELLEECGAGEVAFQLHSSAGDLRSLITSCASNAERKLAIMRERTAKHLASSSPHLLREVWSRYAGYHSPPLQFSIALQTGFDW